MIVMSCNCQPVISILSSTTLHKCGWSTSILPGVAIANDLLLFTALWPPALKVSRLQYYLWCSFQATANFARVRGELAEDKGQSFGYQGEYATVQGQQFVYLGSVIRSSTQSTADIIRHSAITCATMQSLDNYFWKSRILYPNKVEVV